MVLTAEFRWKKVTVHGIKRRASLFNTQRVDHIYQDPHVDNQNFILHYGDLTDSSNLTRILQKCSRMRCTTLAHSPMWR